MCVRLNSFVSALYKRLSGAHTEAPSDQRVCMAINGEHRCQLHPFDKALETMDDRKQKVLLRLAQGIALRHDPPRWTESSMVKKMRVSRVGPKTAKIWPAGREVLTDKMRKAPPGGHYKPRLERRGLQSGTVRGNFVGVDGLRQ